MEPSLSHAPYIFKLWGVLPKDLTEVPLEMPPASASFPDFLMIASRSVVPNQESFVPPDSATPWTGTHFGQWQLTKQPFSAREQVYSLRLKTCLSFVLSHLT